MREGLIALSRRETQPQESQAANRRLDMIQKSINDGKEVQEKILSSLERNSMVQEQLLSFMKQNMAGKI